MTPQAANGPIMLQGNRMEDLRDLTLQWIGRNPLHPLGRTLFLVQSNGIAQWLKTSIAINGDGSGNGVCLGTEVSLPARFQWQAYRSVIEASEGVGAVPVTSPYDKQRLRWRIMALLPTLLTDPGFAPLAHYLRDDEEKRRHFQLAEQLADLFDQYQVYRADWLNDWDAGRDRLRLSGGRETPVPEAQRWQPALWRRIGESLGASGAATHRAAIHQRFLSAAGTLTERPDALPERIVVFGISSLPQPTLEALGALSGVTEVVLCLLNPCQYDWSEIIETQEVLRQQRRQRRRQGMPAALHQHPEQLHLHAHPLLAAWGKQGRDYLQLLAEHDQTDLAAMQALQQPVDFFTEPPAETLLGQLQSDILNLRPIEETREAWPPLDADTDTSIRFHRCHSPQRELEVLHDTLLAAFDEDETLTPRDIMVMVPDINEYAPIIDAVFGQFTHRDRQHLPYHIADQGRRHRAPLLVALEALLALPRSRFRASEMLDLLDIPAVRARFGLAEGDLDTLRRWIEGANIRWGLSAEQRSDLGFPEQEALHTWRFGLERMLMGYAVGTPDGSEADWQGVVPYDEVAGLDAGLVGPLYRLVATLDHYRMELAEPRSATEWAVTLAAMIDATLAPQTAAEQALLGEILTGLETWQQEIEEAAVEDDLPLTVVRESWLAQLDEPGLAQGFQMGGITFATLMPMRAIPFRHVVLLGMNDGDYPRRAEAPDFDLMARRGHYRAGDRSRRDDDRYLFLEALLSARDHLTVSWCARSVRDNSDQPPSVLVGQLRDHLDRGWRLETDDPDASVAEALTTDHPLQPFAETYFQAGSPLFTYANEWRSVRSPVTTQTPSASDDASVDTLPIWVPEAPITLADLVRFLRDPVSALFQQRLGTYAGEDAAITPDEEPFEFDGLGGWQARNALLEPISLALNHAPDMDPLSELERRIDRQQRAGHYPPAPVASAIRDQLLDGVPDTLDRYRCLLGRYSERPSSAPTIQLAVSPVLKDETHTVTLEDSLEGIRMTAANGAEHARLALATSPLIKNKGTDKGKLHWRQILKHWPAHLAAQCLYADTKTILVSPGSTLTLPGLPAAEARATLSALIEQWLYGMQRPTPTHPDFAQPLLTDSKQREKEWEDAYKTLRERSPLFLREYPTLEALVDNPEFSASSEALYGAFQALLEQRTEEKP